MEGDEDSSGQTAPSFFLEGHYYSDGLRHHTFSLDGSRPEWAHQPDNVGFRGEFALNSGVRAVEFSRRLLNTSRVTWLAVYERSMDRKLGDRENYAGVGVWLKDSIVLDARMILDSLIKFSSRIAASGDPGPLTSFADTFMRTYLPRYISPLDAFPDDLMGCPFAERSFVPYRLFDVAFDTGRRPEDIASDQIISLQLARAGRHTFSRALIRLGSIGGAQVDEPEMARLDQDLDVLAELVSDLPHALSGMTTRARTLAIEADTLRSLAEDRERAAVDLRTRHDRIREAVGIETPTISFRSGQVSVNANLSTDLAADIGDLRRKAAEILVVVTRLQADRQSWRRERPHQDFDRVHGQDDRDTRRAYDTDERGYPTWFWALVALTVVAFIGIVGYLLWNRYQ